MATYPLADKKLDCLAVVTFDSQASLAPNGKTWTQLRSLALTKHTRLTTDALLMSMDCGIKPAAHDCITCCVSSDQGYE